MGRKQITGSMGNLYKRERASPMSLDIPLSKMCDPGSTYFDSIKDAEIPNRTVVRLQRPYFINRLLEYAQQIKKYWGPTMPAKEHLDDEYNFPPGRYAGQPH